MSHPPTISPIPVQPGWTFTQGLLLGQASFVVLCLVFIRYVVFQPAEDVDQDEWQRRRDEKRKKTLLSTNVVPPPVPSQILGKTGYEMATHPAESTDWLNVLFAQILQGYRNDMLSNGGEEGARQKIEKWLNPDGGLSWIDPIQVTGLSLGSSYPLLSNARIRPSDGQGHIRAEIDIDYLDSASLSLSTSLLINFPRPRFAVLPVSLGVALASVGGTLSVQIHEPADEKQQLHVCLLPDFHLNLKTTTLLGSRAKLQDIPKLEQLIMTRLRGIIQDRLVHPNHLTLSLPRLQTSSPSMPIVADLGQRAVEAVREGISKAASDFVNLGQEDHLPEQSDQQSLSQPQSHLPSPPASPILGRKRIPMPAGFPGYSQAAMESPALTPTPGAGPSNGDSRRAAPPPPPSFGQSQRPQSTAHSSSYRTPGLAATGRTSSVAPDLANANGSGNGHGSSTNSNSQFRFRGQFASQPPTPGGNPRVGALNSRAPSTQL